MSDQKSGAEKEELFWMFQEVVSGYDEAEIVLGTTSILLTASRNRIEIPHLNGSSRRYNWFTYWKMVRVVDSSEGKFSLTFH